MEERESQELREEEERGAPFIGPLESARFLTDTSFTGTFGVWPEVPVGAPPTVRRGASDQIVQAGSSDDHASELPTGTTGLTSGLLPINMCFGSGCY